jgi:hypothetical protein
VGPTLRVGPRDATSPGGPPARSASVVGGGGGVAARAGRDGQLEKEIQRERNITRGGTRLA